MDVDDLGDAERVIPFVKGGAGIKIRKDMMNELLLVCSSLGTLEEVVDSAGAASSFGFRFFATCTQRR